MWFAGRFAKAHTRAVDLDCLLIVSAGPLLHGDNKILRFYAHAIDCVVDARAVDLVLL